MNLLVLNFEPVEWDYTLQDDKLPSLVKYESYSAAPIRQQPYAYIRAQRMKKAGASNMKILGSKEEAVEKSLPQTSYRAPQLPHSAKSLSSRNLLSAKMIQTSTPAIESGYESSAFPSPSAVGHESRMTFKSIGSEKMTFSSSQIKSPVSTPLKPPLPKSRPATTKSGVSQASVAIQEPPHVQLNHEDIDDEDDDYMQQQDSYLKRRVSWAFDKPLIPRTKEMSLSETKAILRSQMRMKAESIVPPNFIYLTVNAIQNSMKSNLTTANTQQNMRDISTRLLGQKKRPSSSPSKIDPRTKIPVEEMGLDRFRPELEEKADTVSVISEVKSIKSAKSSKKGTEQVLAPDREIIATPCDVQPLQNRNPKSLHPKRIKTSVPKGRVIRPVSANAARKYPKAKESDRPVTAPAHSRPNMNISISTTIASTLPGVRPPQRKATGLLTTGEETHIVPMLMYPPDFKEQIKRKIQEKRQMRMEEESSEDSGPVVGKVSEYNDPLRSHVKFELRTYEQEKKLMDDIEKAFVDQRIKNEEKLEKRKRAAWLAKVKSAAIMDPGGYPNT